MRRNRVKVEGSAYYHVMSRCALQQFLLTGEVKEMFLTMLRRAESFSGVKIVNYCVMDNHFHLLVHVPARRDVSDEELASRIHVLYGPNKAKWIANHWAALKRLGKEEVVQREQLAYRKRMYDISEFMKTFKQRFSLWYCSNHGNLEGTIWQGPFHSVLVEGSHDALGAVSAYITLNPVRAKLVERPEAYRWSAYGAAAAGDRRARSALLSTYADGMPTAMRWKSYAAMVEIAVAESGTGTMIVVDDKDEAFVRRTANNTANTCDGRKVADDARPFAVPYAFGGGDYAGAGGGAGRHGKSKQIGMAKAMALESKVMHLRNHDISRGVAFGSAGFVAAAILRASNTAEVLTFPKAFCLGEELTPLYCAGRMGA